MAKPRVGLTRGRLAGGAARGEPHPTPRLGYIVVYMGCGDRTKVLSKQKVLWHDAQLSAITYNHFGTYIHMYHTPVVTILRIYGFTDLPPSLPLPPADLFTRIRTNQVIAGRGCEGTRVRANA